MGQYEVRHQCDSKTCAYCDRFYQDFKSGVELCSKGHNDRVGRHVEPCDDFVDRTEKYYKGACKYD